VVPGGLSPEQILAEVGEGLLVQSVSGIHSGVNPISGDFSVGAEGLMVRDGQLAEPVREVTIASTLQRMLLNVGYIGNDVERLPSSATGLTIAIADVSMGGA
jgi:PmbA protein